MPLKDYRKINKNGTKSVANGGEMSEMWYVDAADVELDVGDSDDAL